MFYALSLIGILLSCPPRHSVILCHGNLIVMYFAAANLVFAPTIYLDDEEEVRNCGLRLGEIFSSLSSLHFYCL
jgi:hypothetical protein